MSSRKMKKQATLHTNKPYHLICKNVVLRTILVQEEEEDSAGSDPGQWGDEPAGALPIPQEENADDVRRAVRDPVASLAAAGRIVDTMGRTSVIKDARQFFRETVFGR